MQNSDRILIADDHEIVRMGLIRIIKQLKPQAQLFEVDDYKSLHLQISTQNFDLVILDVHMPNGSFQEAVSFIKLKQPNIKILVFSSQDEKIYAVRYLKIGADGFLNKESSMAKIDQALNSMLRSGRYMSDEVKESLISSSLKKSHDTTSPLEILSNRELQIASSLVQGLPMKELSNQLNLHASTISTYKNRVFEKLGIQSIPELVEIIKIYDQ